jgi:hypothetical protein
VSSSCDEDGLASSVEALDDRWEASAIEEDGKSWLRLQLTLVEKFTETVEEGQFWQVCS